MSYSPYSLRSLIFWLMLSVISANSHGRIVDNFNDNTKTAWTDFTFVPGFGLPKEVNGQFVFEQPPAGQALFSASQKVSETITLQEGRTVEMRVDLVKGGGKDSFAVLAFIPTANDAGTLAGYGLAKSTTDVLMTKGINKYFYNENIDTSTAAKNENVTLALTLTVKNGNVIVNAKILDKDNKNGVLFERTYIDSPSADTMADGKDDPAAPYITAGYFTLYLYQDFDAGAPENPYTAVFDNAEVFVTDTTILDDFNDNTKTSWTDSTFIPGFGLPTESAGKFRFEQPPAGQSIFSASQKVSRVFDLVEGEKIEFSVDLVEGGGGDSFAILAFIPTANQATTLAGYALAKSTTDILIVKGINKYFLDQTIGGTPLEKNNNVTLVLSLTGKDGKVIINTKVLDKDKNNEVLFDKTIEDTPSADVMASGKDDPATPFLTGGYFTLYLYQDFSASSPENPYQATFDNAVVSAPPLAANVAPIISEVSPAEFASFLPASTQISFKVNDDKPLVDGKISVSLNGTNYTSSNGLVVSGSGASKTITLSGLKSNQDYAAVLKAEDAEGLSVSKTIYFDTFLAGNITVEIEDYNFDNGNYINSPIPIPEGSGPQPDSYGNQVGYQDVDFNDTRTAPRSQNCMWRTVDPIRMQRSLDNPRVKYVSAGGADALIYDYDVGDIAEGEWLNYTRNFPAGTYEVYLRQSLANMASGESVLELVTGNRTQPNPATKLLGSFLGAKTGFKYRNFALTDGTGLNKITIRLSGISTFRLRQVTADVSDGGRFQNYLIFIPVADTGLQRATISSLLPAPDSATDTVTPTIEVVIQNRDTAVNSSSIKLELNGQVLAPKITTESTGVRIQYAFASLPAAGTTNSSKVTFKDDQGTEQTSSWQFVINYQFLDPAIRKAGTPGSRGFNMRFVQAPSGTALENSLERAENQLKSNSTIPKAVEKNFVEQVVNFNERVGESAGSIGDDLPIPGLDEANGLDDYALEAIGYLELAAGVYRFGMISDDGYKIVSAANYTDPNTPPLAFRSGGTANETFNFVVSQPGYYPFRLVWYERGGAGNVEWCSVDIASGEKILINDPASSKAIKAYTQITPPPLTLQSSATVNGAFQADTGAVLDATAKTITASVAGSMRFYRIAAPNTVRIKSIKVASQKVVIEYE